MTGVQTCALPIWFFHELGQPTDDTGAPTVPFIPPMEQMIGAFQKFGNIPKLDQQWKE